MQTDAHCVKSAHSDKYCMPLIRCRNKSSGKSKALSFHHPVYARSNRHAAIRSHLTFPSRTSQPPDLSAADFTAAWLLHSEVHSHPAFPSRSSQPFDLSGPDVINSAFNHRSADFGMVCKLLFQPVHRMLYVQAARPVRVTFRTDGFQNVIGDVLDEPIAAAM